jgi:hypothetical protein
VILHRQHARYRPLPVLGKADLADKSVELVGVHVTGELPLIQAADRPDRLFQHLHHRVGIGRQVEAERVDAFLDRAPLVLGEELVERRELAVDLRHVGLVIDHAVQQRPKLRLQRRKLRADEAAAEHPGLEADFVCGAHHARGVRRVRRQVNEVRVGRLDRPHDRRIVDRLRRIGLVVDDLQAEPLDVRARAFQRQVRVLRVGTDQSDGLRLRIQGHRGLEEAACPVHRGVGPGRHDLEVAVVLELAVDVEAEQAHEHELALHHERHRRRDDVGAVARHDHVHLVHVEELGVDAGHRCRIGLVVVVDQLDLAAEQAAPGVDVLRPDLHRDQRGLAVARERAGQAHAEADLERLLRGRRADERERDCQGAQNAPC